MKKQDWLCWSRIKTNFDYFSKKDKISISKKFRNLTNNRWIKLSFQIFWFTVQKVHLEVHWSWNCLRSNRSWLQFFDLPTCHSVLLHTIHYILCSNNFRAELILKNTYQVLVTLFTSKVYWNISVFFSISISRGNMQNLTANCKIDEFSSWKLFSRFKKSFITISAFRNMLHGNKFIACSIVFTEYQEAS